MIRRTEPEQMRSRIGSAAARDAPCVGRPRSLSRSLFTLGARCDRRRTSGKVAQRAAIASFGSFALRERDLLKILTEAARVCADGLRVPFSNVCRYRAAENDLFVVAGHGWHDGVIGHVVSRADASSPQGRAFTTGEPTICGDLRKDSGFEL